MLVCTSGAAWDREHNKGKHGSCGTTAVFLRETAFYAPGDMLEEEGGDGDGYTGAIGTDLGVSFVLKSSEKTTLSGGETDPSLGRGTADLE